MSKLKSIALGLLAAATLFTTTSCEKKEKGHDHQEPPATTTTITITTPTEGQAIDHHAMVNVTGKIESNVELHGYKIIIRQKSDNSVKFEQNKHAHGTTINFNESWENNVDGMQDMELEVIAVVDHDGNTTNKKLNFHCHGH